jgi:hypothetical protein
MAWEREFGSWTLDREMMRGITAERARDIMAECMYAVHGPHFAQTKQHMGVPYDDAAIRRSVQGTLRLAFKTCKGDYDNPTRESLERVLDHLGRKALAWGAADALVRRHRAQLARVISRLPE